MVETIAFDDVLTVSEAAYRCNCNMLLAAAHTAGVASRPVNERRVWSTRRYADNVAGREFSNDGTVKPSRVRSFLSAGNGYNSAIRLPFD